MRTRRANHLSVAKIKTVPALKKICSRLKAQGKRVVFTNGCFDLLHYGHVKYLEDAGRQGDVLLVAVNTDASVRRIKGKARPIMNERDRSRIIAALACVDYVVLFGEDTPLKLIQELIPDVLIKGSDWDKKRIVGSDIVLRHGGRVLTVKRIPDRSTTDIIEKIVQEK